MLTTTVCCCSLAFAAVSYTFNLGYNLKHMGYLTTSVCEYYVSQLCVCSQSYAHTHSCTHTDMLIIGPVSNETHPLPICYMSPVKIFLLIYNNSLQTFLQTRLDRMVETCVSKAALVTNTHTPE